MNTQKQRDQCNGSLALPARLTVSVCRPQSFPVGTAPTSTPTRCSEPPCAPPAMAWSPLPFEEVGRGQHSELGQLPPPSTRPQPDGHATWWPLTPVSSLEQPGSGRAGARSVSVTVTAHPALVPEAQGVASVWTWGGCLVPQAGPAERNPCPISLPGPHRHQVSVVVQWQRCCPVPFPPPPPASRHPGGVPQVLDCWAKWSGCFRSPFCPWEHKSGHPPAAAQSPWVVSCCLLANAAGVSVPRVGASPMHTEDMRLPRLRCRPHCWL